MPQPNDHVIALRCLSILPSSVWDDALGKHEMSVIMEGMNSDDDTTRKMVGG